MSHYHSTHCDTAQIWWWWTQYTSPAHNGYPAIYVVFVCRGEKSNGRALCKSNDVAKKTNAVLYCTQRSQPSLLLRIVMVSAKTFTAYLSVYIMNWQITVQQKRKIYFSLDFRIVPYSIGLRIYKQYMYFLVLVLATLKQRSLLLLKRWRKPPEKIRAHTEVPREILSFWQTKR